MEKVAPNSNLLGILLKIIRQSKIKGTLILQPLLIQVFVYLISKLCYIDLTRIMVQEDKISTIDALGCTRHLKNVIVLRYPKRDEPINLQIM